MLAVVKTPRTEIKIKGVIPALVLDVLEQEYGTALHIKTEKGEEELVRVKDTLGYKMFKRRMKPGDYIRLYRENRNLTQETLGEKIGHTRAFVCDIEKSRRPVSKALAKRLSEIFGASPLRFI